MDNMRSSYIKNNYDMVLSSLVIASGAKEILELGVLDGYSTMALAQGAKFNDGWVYAYDLFEKYPYKKSSFEEVSLRLENKNISLYQDDVYSVMRTWGNNCFDFLHIDVSHDGNDLIKLFELWFPKVKRNGIIVTEGGSKERDNVTWMKKYYKRPIREVLPILSNKYNLKYVILERFPSMTIWRAND